MQPTADEARHWTYVRVSATPPEPGRTVSQYKLAVIEELLGRAGIDPETGELSMAVRVPGTFQATTCEHLARSLARAVLYNAGIRGWNVR